MNNLSKLIQKLETVKKGNRDLDIKLAQCLGFNVHESFNIPYITDPSSNTTRKLLPYTTSIDSVLKLMPKRVHSWKLYNSAKPTISYAKIWLPHFVYLGRAYSPAIAFCLTILEIKRGGKYT